MSRRIPVLVLLVGPLVALVLGDREAPTEVLSAFEQADARGLPVADDADALSSTWFCAAGGASEDEGSALFVTVANAGAGERRGTISWHTGDGVVEVVAITVPGLDSIEVAASDSVSAAQVSATVELDGGEVGVEHRIVTDRGTDVAPCASTASSTWYLANGTTARDASQRLVLFNPFPDDAVVDLSFSTDEGRDEPAALQGLPVPAGSTEIVELTEHVRRRNVTATSVIARRGRLVVDRVQSFDGEGGRTGVALTVAAPAPAEVWAFGEGYAVEGLTERWHLYNPTEREAVASLEIVPDVGELPEPVDLTIPPRGLVTVEATELARVPAGVGHRSTVRSLNGVPVVAERSIDARPPSGREGWTSSLGSPTTARRWLLPYGAVTEDIDEWLVVANPGAEAVTVDVTTLDGGRLLDIDGLSAVELGPADRKAIRLRPRIERSPLPLLVEATGPIVVERELYQIGREVDGVSSVIGVPLP